MDKKVKKRPKIELAKKKKKSPERENPDPEIEELRKYPLNLLRHVLAINAMHTKHKKREEALTELDIEESISAPLDHIPSVPTTLRLSKEADERVKELLTAK